MIISDPPKPYFAEGELYTYLGSIDAYGKNITGHLRIKRISTTSVRMVFTNESGFQLLALELSDGEMNTHFAFEKLDKKIVLNTIERDLQLIFYESLCDQFFREPENTVIIECANKKHNYRFQLSGNQNVEKIFVESGDKTDMTVNFAAPEAVPDTIRIDHRDIKLNYLFYRIDEE